MILQQFHCMMFSPMFKFSLCVFEHFLFNVVYVWWVEDFLMFCHTQPTGGPHLMGSYLFAEVQSAYSNSPSWQSDLHRRLRIFHPTKSDIKPSDGEAPVLELWRMESTTSLSLLPVPLWHEVVVPVKFLSMGQIELFNHSLWANNWLVSHWFSIT